jgi:hypothetical protein
MTKHKRIRSMLEEHIADAYELGHQHARNAFAGERGRVDEGWEQVLDRAAKAISGLVDGQVEEAKIALREIALLEDPEDRVAMAKVAIANSPLNRTSGSSGSLPQPLQAP